MVGQLFTSIGMLNAIASMLEMKLAIRVQILNGTIWISKVKNMKNK